MDIKQAFGIVVKDLRNQRGWSQEKLAENAGISMRTVSVIEGNKHNPSITMIEDLAKAFGVKASELVKLAEEYSQPVNIK